MADEHGLGRGLESLLPGTDRFSMSASGRDAVVTVKVSDIATNPHQPRQSFEHGDLEDLINSIREHGILQPLIVSRTAGGTFELIAGERRLRAAKFVGLTEVPVVIRRASEQQKLELALVENVQRKDLNPIERAVGYQHLVEEFNLTQEEIAKRVGQSRASVTNTLRLLSLPDAVKQALREGRLTEGHGKALLSLPTEAEQLALAKRILLHNLTVRQTEAHVRPVRAQRHPSPDDPLLAEYEQTLRSALGTKVTISGARRGGRIVIEFYSEEELQGILDKVKASE